MLDERISRPRGMIGRGDNNRGAPRSLIHELNAIPGVLSRRSCVWFNNDGAARNAEVPGIGSHDARFHIRVLDIRTGTYERRRIPCMKQSSRFVNAGLQGRTCRSIGLNRRAKHHNNVDRARGLVDDQPIAKHKDTISDEDEHHEQRWNKPNELLRGSVVEWLHKASVRRVGQPEAWQLRQPSVLPANVLDTSAETSPKTSDPRRESGSGASCLTPRNNTGARGPWPAGLCDG